MTKRLYQRLQNTREVEDDANQLAASLRQEPPNVQLIFTVPDGVDYRRFNPPACNGDDSFLTHQTKWL